MAFSSVNNIDISGNTEFLEKTDNLITQLKSSGAPVETKVRKLQSLEEDGVISVELKEPRNGLKGGLFCITNEAGATDPIIQRFTLTLSANGSSTLGLTFSMSHPEFNRALTQELKSLIGEF